jgi:hypothetical protein
MLRTLLLAVFICCSITNIAQPLTFSNKFAVKVTPSSLPYYMQLPVGVEYFFAKKYGVGIQVGVPFKKTISNKEHLESGMKFRAELRDYIKTTKRARYFVGFEAYYTKMEFALKNGSYLMQGAGEKDVLGNSLTGGTMQYYTADVTHTNLGGGFLFGSMARIASNLFFDWNIGISFHFSKGEYNNVVRDYNQLTGPYGRLQPRDGLLDNTYNTLRDGPYKMFYTPMALRLSYVIAGKK